MDRWQHQGQRQLERSPAGGKSEKSPNRAPALIAQACAEGRVGLKAQGMIVSGRNDRREGSAGVGRGGSASDSNRRGDGRVGWQRIIRHERGGYDEMGARRWSGGIQQATRATTAMGGGARGREEKSSNSCAATLRTGTGARREADGTGANLDEVDRNRTGASETVKSAAEDGVLEEELRARARVRRRPRRALGRAPWSRPFRP